MKIQSLITKEVETMPKQMEEGVFYLSRKFELGIHLCACGCGGQAVTPLSGTGPAVWKLTEGPNGATLEGSIGHQNWPCKSHYWVRDGKIVPC
jgi:hypothetical protein